MVKIMSETRKVKNNINIEDARLIFKNFAGKGTQFNEEGNRNFGVILDHELADQLIEDGWRVKYLKPAEDDPDQVKTPWLSVKVKFNPYPPVCQLITERGIIKMNEETIDQLDWSHIKTCDIIIRPYNYPAVKGRPAGVSAYLKAIYVQIEEDNFSKKYANIPVLN